MKILRLILVFVVLVTVAWAAIEPKDLEEQESKEIQVHSRSKRGILLAKAALLGGGALLAKKALIGKGFILGAGAGLAGAALYHKVHRFKGGYGHGGYHGGHHGYYGNGYGWKSQSYQPTYYSSGWNKW